MYASQQSNYWASNSHTPLAADDIVNQKYALVLENDFSDVLQIASTSKAYAQFLLESGPTGVYNHITKSLSVKARPYFTNDMLKRVLVTSNMKVPVSMKYWPWVMKTEEQLVNDLLVALPTFLGAFKVIQSGWQIVLNMISSIQIKTSTFWIGNSDCGCTCSLFWTMSRPDSDESSVNQWRRLRTIPDQSLDLMQKQYSIFSSYGTSVLACIARIHCKIWTNNVQVKHTLYRPTISYPHSLLSIS